MQLRGQFSHLAGGLCDEAGQGKDNLRTAERLIFSGCIVVGNADFVYVLEKTG
jgi:hypothetical protein